MAKTGFKFNGKTWGDKLYKRVVNLQSQLLVDYAKRIIVEIGDAIQAFNSANHMDRTGNLLNSLCWGVYHKGTLKGSGFYRAAVIRSMGGNKGSTAFLHEFFANDAEPVNGRELAENFLASYKPTGNGWTIFFAILAPYWGYWESGFTMKSHFGGGTQRMQFQVMSHIFDEVRMDLKPAKVTLTVRVPKYSYKNPKYRNKKGYKKIGLLR